MCTVVSLHEYIFPSPQAYINREGCHVRLASFCVSSKALCRFLSVLRSAVSAELFCIFLFLMIIMNASTSNNPVSANHIHNALRLNGVSSAIGPLRPARSNDSVTLQKTALEISRQVVSSRQLMFATGFGMHRSCIVPIRLPALLLPGLRAMKRLQDLGLSVPTYTVYQATDFIIETNQYSPEKARICSVLMSSYLQAYVNRFHPCVAEYVQLHFDCPYSPAIRQNISDVRTRFKALKGLPDAMMQLQKYEQNQSDSEDQYELYAAANAFYSCADSKYPFAAEAPNNHKIILPIGGQAEKPFFAITSLVADQSQKTVIPMLTTLGSRPTYYPYPSSKDPLSIKEYAEAIRSPLNDGPLRVDIAAMDADGATADALEDIYPVQL